MESTWHEVRDPFLGHKEAAGDRSSLLLVPVLRSALRADCFQAGHAAAVGSLLIPWSCQPGMGD